MIFGDTHIYRQHLEIPIDSNVARPIEVTWQAVLCWFMLPATNGNGGE